VGTYAGAPTRPVPTSISPFGREPTWIGEEEELSDKGRVKEKSHIYISRFFVM
jgi:hypothetical protein